MDSNRTVQFKQVYPHTQFNLYSPVIDATMPNLASGLNLVSTACSVPPSLAHDGNHLSALATLQASSVQSTSPISLPSTAQLVPMTTLNNLQLQQMQQHQTYIDQASNMSKSGSQFLQVQLANNLPAMAPTPNNPAQMSHNHVHMPNNTNATHSPSVTSKKSSTFVDGANTEAGSKSNNLMSNTPLISSNKRSSNQNNNASEGNASGDGQSNGTTNKITTATNGKDFRCQLCNREFKNNGNLKTHALTHLDQTERPYDCETCGRKFTQKGNRDIHVKIHTGTRDHTCPYCDRGFVQRGNLKTHIRSVHTGEKPYACSHCGKQFSQKANMLTHFRTHDKNSRFSCNSCNKTFSQKGNLKTHQQRHVQPTTTTRA